MMHIKYLQSFTLEHAFVFLLTSQGAHNRSVRKFSYLYYLWTGNAWHEWKKSCAVERCCSVIITAGKSLTALDGGMNEFRHFAPWHASAGFGRVQVNHRVFVEQTHWQVVISLLTEADSWNLHQLDMIFDTPCNIPASCRLHISQHSSIPLAHFANIYFMICKLFESIVIPFPRVMPNISPHPHHAPKASFFMSLP